MDLTLELKSFSKAGSNIDSFFIISIYTSPTIIEVDLSALLSCCDTECYAATPLIGCWWAS